MMGGGALGLAVGWLVVHFLQRFTVFDAKALAAVVGVVAGGVVSTFLGVSGVGEKWVPWTGYCLGLAFGIVTFGLRYSGAPPTEARNPRLRMLDELNERQYGHKGLTSTDFDELKKAILEDIKNNPQITDGPSVKEK